jgi:hypothetical protein
LVAVLPPLLADLAGVGLADAPGVLAGAGLADAPGDPVGVGLAE